MGDPAATVSTGVIAGPLLQGLRLRWCLEGLVACPEVDVYRLSRTMHCTGELVLAERRHFNLPSATSVMLPLAGPNYSVAPCARSQKLH